MNSPLLNSIGLGSLDIAYVLIALITDLINSNQRFNNYI